MQYLYLSFSAYSLGYSLLADTQSRIVIMKECVCRLLAIFPSTPGLI